MARPTLQFLGSGDALGSGGRLQACFLLDGGPSRVLIDCGATSLVAMKRDGIDPSSIETVLISHLHGDHFAGIPYLVLDGQFSKREAMLLVAGPPGIKERVEQAMEVLYPGSSAAPRSFALEFAELSDRRPERLGAAAVTAYTVEHASGAPPYALRVEYGGKVVAYSGDTQWTDALLVASADADLFVCEAFFFAKKVKFHLDLATLRANIGRITARRIVLTHMSADMLAHAGEAGIETASDGLVVDL